MKLVLAILTIVVSTSLSATVDHPYLWNSVHVEAERDVSLTLIRNKESLKIETFSLKIEGKEIEIEKKWFDDLEQPEFRTVKITWGCGPLNMNEDGKLSSPSCSSHVSFNFWIKLKDEELPLWYEDPRVIYYIKDGKITSRLVVQKDAENHWSHYWTKANGETKTGEMKSFSH